ncbi:hypothetical protein BC629DRAFT_1582239 [Irpex lacteus]|nr:hypothetical protein BC629DRAFT_1582239 [Irpex lacteus]
MAKIGLTVSLVSAALAALGTAAASDPCAAIAGKKWVDPEIKANIVEVVNKTLAFHTSNLLADLARISHQHYNSDFDLHIDLSRTLKRLNDGHCVYINSCFDCTSFVSFLPTPLNVHIAPEAFNVSSVEFADEIQVWQDALPGPLKGQLASLSGAKVLAINGAPPFVAVDANALIAGSFQPLGTRENGFFSSYQHGASGWNYILGNFAQQALPLNDFATLTILRNGQKHIETITLPYRSRLSSGAVKWTDSASFRQNNCVAIEGTNGENLNDPSNPLRRPTAYRQQAPISPADARKHPINAILDTIPLLDVALPPALSLFHLLADKKTGVLALGSFSDSSFDGFEKTLLTGLQNLKAAGATQLIVDVTNNGGGFICIAHHPQAGLNTTARAAPLAQLINNTFFPPGFDWLDPAVHKNINGRPDAFSLTLSDGCQPFDLDPPDEALFDPHKVVIVSNGRCASSCRCSKTVVIGGRQGVEQRYCGTVGGQSTDFSTIDTEVKTALLKNNSLAPPDFKTNSVQGITWRLGFGINNPSQPEEWQDHPADLNLPLTVETVNNPLAIWTEVAKRLLH